jgi:alpha-tubulin suppressor-like RCC1 family protein
VAALACSTALVASAAPGPRPVRFASVDVGGAQTCALTTAGGVKCWGYNGQGQLGNGTKAYSSAAPVDVKGLTRGVKAVAVGGAHACALTTRGGVKCWGFASGGQLGHGQGVYQSNTPVDVKGLGSGVRAITAGSVHSCALMTRGGV